MKLLFLSAHLYPSKNNAGFHHLANAANALGHTVFFCTVPNTPFNFLQDLLKNRSRFWCRVRTLPSIIFNVSKHNIEYASYISLLYPWPKYYGYFSLKLFMFKWGFSRLFLQKSYDVIIIESCAALLLVDRLKKKYPLARFIYRVSDLLDMIGADPNLIAIEKKLLPKFDIVSTPIQSMTELLKKSCKNATIVTHEHAINPDEFNLNKKKSTPYQTKTNAIYIGMYPDIDLEFIEIASQQFPEIDVHIFGPYKPIIKRKNIHYYGVTQFKFIVPYIVHASIGLHCVKKNKSNTDLTHSAKSLKFMQYTYAKLPIIAPQAMQITEPHVFSYTNNPTAIEAALSYPKDQINTDHISSWDNLIQTLLDSCR